MKPITIDYKSLLKGRGQTSVSVSGEEGKKLLNSLTPTELAELFPDYYKKPLPDVSGFQKATSRKYGRDGGSTDLGQIPSAGASARGTTSRIQKIQQQKFQLPEDQKEVLRNLSKQPLPASDPRARYLNQLSKEELDKIGIEKHVPEKATGSGSGNAGGGGGGWGDDPAPETSVKQPEAGQVEYRAKPTKASQMSDEEVEKSIGKYRPPYKLSDADLSDHVVNVVAGEARVKDRESVDAVINNMLNRVGTKGWGPSDNLLSVARAPGQYAGYRKATEKEKEFIRGRIKEIASGDVPDNTKGANAFRSTSYVRGEGRGKTFARLAESQGGRDIGGNTFAYDKSVPHGPYAPYEATGKTAPPRGPVPPEMLAARRQELEQREHEERITAAEKILEKLQSPTTRPVGTLGFSDAMGGDLKNQPRISPYGASTDSEFYRDPDKRQGSPFNYAATRQGREEFGDPSPNNPNIIGIKTASGKSVRVHQKIAGDAQAFLNELEARGYNIKSLGGFAYRQKTSGGGLSTHSWGTTLDINPDQNPYIGDRRWRGARPGTTDMPEDVKYLAMKYGFAQLGNDRMHFERVSPEMRRLYLERLIRTGKVSLDDPYIQQKIKDGAISDNVIKEAQAREAEKRQRQETPEAQKLTPTQRSAGNLGLTPETSDAVMKGEIINPNAPKEENPKTEKPVEPKDKPAATTKPVAPPVDDIPLSDMGAIPENTEPAPAPAPAEPPKEIRKIPLRAAGGEHKAEDLEHIKAFPIDKSIRQGNENAALIDTRKGTPLAAYNTKEGLSYDENNKKLSIKPVSRVQPDSLREQRIEKENAQAQKQNEQQQRSQQQVAAQPPHSPDREFTENVVPTDYVLNSTLGRQMKRVEFVEAGHYNQGTANFKPA